MRAQPESPGNPLASTPWPWDRDPDLLVSVGSQPSLASDDYAILIVRFPDASRHPGRFETQLLVVYISLLPRIIPAACAIAGETFGSVAIRGSLTPKCA